MTVTVLSLATFIYVYKWGQCVEWMLEYRQAMRMSAQQVDLFKKMFHNMQNVLFFVWKENIL